MNSLLKTNQRHLYWIQNLTQSNLYKCLRQHKHLSCVYLLDNVWACLRMHHRRLPADGVAKVIGVGLREMLLLMIPTRLVHLRSSFVGRTRLVVGHVVRPCAPTGGRRSFREGHVCGGGGEYLIHLLVTVLLLCIRTGDFLPILFWHWRRHTCGETIL